MRDCYLEIFGRKNVSVLSQKQNPKHLSTFWPYNLNPQWNIYTFLNSNFQHLCTVQSLFVCASKLDCDIVCIKHFVFVTMYYQARGIYDLHYTMHRVRECLQCQFVVEIVVLGYRKLIITVSNDGLQFDLIAGFVPYSL